MYPTPCDHPKCGCGGLCDSGHPCPMADNVGPLCPDCRAEFEEDAAAWEEFGNHPRGRANWEAAQEEMAEWYADNVTYKPVDLSELPF